MNLRKFHTIFFTALLLSTTAGAQVFDAQTLGLTTEKQSRNYWLEQSVKQNSIPITSSLLSSQQIDAINQKLRETEPSYTDIKILPKQMPASQIRERINRLSKRPVKKLYDQYGVLLSEQNIDLILGNVNLHSLSGNQTVNFGLIVKRTALRTFPTDLRVFKQPGDTDIDRFQESAIFPGTPVAILNKSADQQWLFVVSELYSAWVKSDDVALGSREEMIAYMQSTPRVLITDIQARTAFTPERPEVSNVALDMGVSLPWLKQWPIADAVNGQGSLASYVISLPIRGKDNRIKIIPALLPRKYDVSEHYLPVSKMDLILQSFKFLGERYGWGHDYGARDCSGFVSEVYRSMGLLLPRNTSDQERSLAYDREPFAATLSRDQRIEKIKRTRIGDLIYIPGHVMMVIGHDNYGPWVIHDSHATGFIQYGYYYSVPTNGVAITPILSMAFSAEKTYIEAVTSIQHIIPRQNQ